MIRVLGTVFAALLGLAFGSFLNVCLSRWPEGESVARPRSHCRTCGRTLHWWENIPLLSWLALRGRCLGCRSRISWRYPLVESAVGLLWAAAAFRALDPSFNMDAPSTGLLIAATDAVCKMAFYWVLLALAFLDAEHLWLPNWLTLPGAALGFVWTNVLIDLDESRIHIGMGPVFAAIETLLGIFAAAAAVLLIRWIYLLVRHQEGIGLGDAKLMALLAAWLGLPGAMLSFVLGVLMGAATALAIRIFPLRRHSHQDWASIQLPLGTFLCAGAIMSAFWGQQIIATYLRWAGF